MFGSIVGERLELPDTPDTSAWTPAQSASASRATAAGAGGAAGGAAADEEGGGAGGGVGGGLRPVGIDELSRHASEESCWVALHGKVRLVCSSEV